MEIKKGSITDYDYTTNYDDDGIAYKLFTIKIDGKQFTSKAPKDISLLDGAIIVYEFEGNVISAAYCPADGMRWGKNSRKLKKHAGAGEEFTFKKGIVTEKRQETSSTVGYSSTTGTVRQTSIGFIVILGEERFNASYQFGKKLKPGDEIAAVLVENSVVLQKDLKTGKFIGKQKPYFILAALLIVALNITIPYIQLKYPDLLKNVTALYIVFNSLFGIVMLISVATFIGGNKAMKRMNAELAR